MSEYFSSLIDNFKTRITNPFLGTLIAVWLYRNWMVVYAIFNFDEDCNMIDKMYFILKHFYQLNFWQELGLNLMWTTFILIITLIMLGFSKIIVDFYYKVVARKITVWIDKSAILTKYEAEELNRQIQTTTDIIKSKNDQIQSYESDIKLLGATNANAKIENAELIKKNSKLLIDYEDALASQKSAQNITDDLLVESLKNVSFFEEYALLMEPILDGLDEVSRKLYEQKIEIFANKINASANRNTTNFKAMVHKNAYLLNIRDQIGNEAISRLSINPDGEKFLDDIGIKKSTQELMINENLIKDLNGSYYLTGFGKVFVANFDSWNFN